MYVPTNKKDCFIIMHVYCVQEFMRVLAELEGELEELDGWGQLLIKDCVKPDAQVIENRVDEMRSVNINHIFYIPIIPRLHCSSLYFNVADFIFVELWPLFCS